MGCGDSGPEIFKVTGTVSFEGTPLTEGSITLEDNNTGVADSFDIGPNGSYVAEMPAGSYLVSVQPPMVEVADSANSEGGEEFKRVSNVPQRYWSSYESKLSVSVTGETSFDVNMTKR